MKKIAILIIAFVIMILGFIGYISLNKEHKEALNVSLNDNNFQNLKDGIFIGNYEGGMFKWRANRIELEIKNGKLLKIKMLDSTDYGKKNIEYEEIFKRIIESQSLKVDAISGATLTTKGILKAVELGLVKSAQNQE